MRSLPLLSCNSSERVVTFLQFSPCTVGPSLSLSPLKGAAALQALLACLPPHSALLPLVFVASLHNSCWVCLWPWFLALVQPLASESWAGPEQEGLVPSCFQNVYSVVFSCFWDIVCVWFGLAVCRSRVGVLILPTALWCPPLQCACPKDCQLPVQGTRICVRVRVCVRTCKCSTNNHVSRLVTPRQANRFSGAGMCKVWHMTPKVGRAEATRAERFRY